LGVLRRVQVSGLTLRRPLSLLTDPQRYESRAAKVFREQILANYANGLLSPQPST
jgi:hypothetical protein